MSKETQQPHIEQALQSVDLAVANLEISQDPRVGDFSSENDGHGLPGRVFSFVGKDSVSRNIHIYIDDSKKDLEMNVEVNAWTDIDAKRKFANKLIDVLSIPALPNPIKDAIKKAFETVLTFNQADLHA